LPFLLEPYEVQDIADLFIPGIDDNLDEDDLNLSQNVYEKYFNSSPISLSGNEREFDCVDIDKYRESVLLKTK
jgi:hypothetical protein